MTIKIIAITIDIRKLYSAIKLIINGTVLPLATPITKSRVNDISLPEPNILPPDEIRSGGIPEKPRPIRPIPRKFIICDVGNIERTKPIRLIMDNDINKAPALNLYDKKLIINLPIRIPNQNTEATRLASLRLKDFIILKKVGAQENTVISDIT